MQINEISKTLEKYKNSPDFIDLTDTNFTGNGFIFPKNLLSAGSREYFSQRSYQPDPKGLISARNAISDYYFQNNAVVSPDNILITASTSESYHLLFSSLTKPGDELLMPEPGYPLFTYLAELSGLKIKSYRLREEQSWEIDLDSLSKQINPRTKAIILISPNNPTGSIIKTEQLLSIIEIANRADLKIIFDEVFSEFIYMHQHESIMNLYTKTPVFALNGISKMFALPDLKLAWIAATGEEQQLAPILDKLETINDIFLNSNYLTQSILPGLFKHGKKFQTKMVKQVSLNRRQLITGLKPFKDNIKFNMPQGGVHAFISFKKHKNLTEEEFIIDLIKKCHVFVHPGYFYDYPESKNYFHTVVSFLKNSQAIKKALEKISDYLLLFR